VQCYCTVVYANPASTGARASGPALISVVMPVRNAAGSVSAAVESVLRQTESAWELIAVDDGSTDASASILEVYAGRDPRVRVIRADRGGLVSALNTGLCAAAGSLIARLDADDVCMPERLARQRRHLESRPDLGLVASRVDFGGDPARAAGYARYVDWTNRLMSHDEISLARFVESPLAHPSVMFRRALVDRWGGYAHGDFPEDYELWLRWLDAGVRMEKLADTLVVWNDSPTRLSRRDRRYAKDAFYRLKARYLARWLARHNRHHPAITLWGAGRITRKRAQHLMDHGAVVQAFIDIDPDKIGRRIRGRPVLSPAELPPAGSAFVVSYVGSSDAREHIESALKARGYRCGVDYILAA
jgi:glycosyltransferase involved in cell wall biosynthesis